MSTRPCHSTFSTRAIQYSDLRYAECAMGNPIGRPVRSMVETIRPFTSIDGWSPFTCPPDLRRHPLPDLILAEAVDPHHREEADSFARPRPTMHDACSFGRALLGAQA